MSLFSAVQSFGADYDPDVDATSFSEAGKAITLHDKVNNPYYYPADASIEFVFENIEGDNFWDSKKHTGKAEPQSNFVTHQGYFIEHVGRFYIHMNHEIDGKQTEKKLLEFIVFEKHSKAAMEGCGAEYEWMVKPDYSELVCVFDDSVAKLAQRGWITD